MPRTLLFLTVLMLTAPAAPATEMPGRYVLEKVEQGFLRLDRETGAMALCAAKAGVWVCEAVKDASLDRAAELARLRAENDKLKARIAELERDGGAIKLPSDQEVDRMMNILSKMFDRFLDFAREMDGRSKDGTSL